MKFRHLYHNEKNCRTRQIFRNFFLMNVVYFSKVFALNSFSLDDFYTVTSVTLLLSLYSNNLINKFFVSIYKCVTGMTFYAQICTKKSSKWSTSIYSKLCVVGIKIRKYILRWTCVYRINFKIRNSKIQANHTAKVEVVRESPFTLCTTLSYCPII